MKISKRPRLKWACHCAGRHRKRLVFRSNVCSRKSNSPHIGRTCARKYYRLTVLVKFNSIIMNSFYSAWIKSIGLPLRRTFKLAVYSFASAYRAGKKNTAPENCVLYIHFPSIDCNVFEIDEAYPLYA